MNMRKPYPPRLDAEARTLQVLRLIRATPGTTRFDLADEIDSAMSTVDRALRKLVAEGKITKVRDTTNSRYWRLYEVIQPTTKVELDRG